MAAASRRATSPARAAEPGHRVAHLLTAKVRAEVAADVEDPSRLVTEAIHARGERKEGREAGGVRSLSPLHRGGRRQGSRRAVLGLCLPRAQPGPGRDVARPVHVGVDRAMNGT